MKLVWLVEIIKEANSIIYFSFVNDSFKSIGVFHRNIWYKVLDLNLLKSKNTQEDTPVMIPFIGQEERNISSPCHETSFIPIIPIISRYRQSFIQVTTRNRLKRAISRYNIDEFKSLFWRTPRGYAEI